MTTDGEKTAKAVSAALLIIGDEVLSGRTRDTHLPYLAGWLNELGVQLREARVIPDAVGVIRSAVLECSSAFDHVFTTGGIGPTHDDVTSEAVALAFGTELELRDEAVEALAAYYGTDQLNEARLKMARVPAGATLIDNPVTGAPGFQLGNVFVLPGIPRIMQGMLEGMRHRVAGGRPLASRGVRAFFRESDLAEHLSQLLGDHPGVTFGSYPFFKGERPGVTVVARGEDEAGLEKAAAALTALLERLGAEQVEAL